MCRHFKCANRKTGLKLQINSSHFNLCVKDFYLWQQSQPIERLTVTATPTQTAPPNYVILYLISFIPAHNNTVSARLHLILDSLPLLLSSTSEAAHVSRFCHPPSSSRLFLSPNPSFPFNHSPFCSCAASEDSREECARLHVQQQPAGEDVIWTGILP